LTTNYNHIASGTTKQEKEVIRTLLLLIRTIFIMHFNKIIFFLDCVIRKTIIQIILTLILYLLLFSAPISQHGGLANSWRHFSFFSMIAEQHYTHNSLQKEIKIKTSCKTRSSLTKLLAYHIAKMHIEKQQSREQYAHI
jgi:hypothetical protein